MSAAEFADKVGILAEAAMATGDWRGFLNTLSPASRAKCGGLVISEASIGHRVVELGPADWREIAEAA